MICPRSSATTIAPIPRWALLQRQIFATLDQAAIEFADRYTRADGTLIWRDRWPGMDGSDDPYEGFMNMPLFYALGGSEEVYERSRTIWDGITWQWTEYGQIHREFDAYYDWMHHGESNLFFYFFGLCDPDVPKDRQRARRFAGFYNGEDAEALNWDAERRLIRSPITGSRGPRHHPDRRGLVDASRDSRQLPAAVRGPAGHRSLRHEDAVVGRCDLRGNPEAHQRAAVARRRAAQPRRDVADDARLHVHRRGEVPPLGARLSRRVAGAHRAQRRHHTRQYRAVRRDRRIQRRQVVGRLLRLALAARLGVAARTARASPAPMRRCSPATCRTSIWPRSQLDMLWELRREEGGKPLVPNRHYDAGWRDYRHPHPMFGIYLWNVSMDEADADAGRARLGRQNCSTQVTPAYSSYGQKTAGGHMGFNGNTAQWFRFIRGHWPDYPEQILASNLETDRQADRDLSQRRVRSADHRSLPRVDDHPHVAAAHADDHRGPDATDAGRPDARLSRWPAAGALALLRCSSPAARPAPGRRGAGSWAESGQPPPSRWSTPMPRRRPN